MAWNCCDFVTQSFFTNFSSTYEGYLDSFTGRFPAARNGLFFKTIGLIPVQSQEAVVHEVDSSLDAFNVSS